MTLDLTRHWNAASRKLRGAQTVGLFLDFDGTLSRIRPKPDEAKMDGDIRRTLSLLARSSRFRVWIVSGRRLHDLRQRAHIPNVRYLGLHGWEGRGTGILSRPAEQALRQLAVTLAPLERANIWIEDKQYSLAIHYRGASAMDRNAARCSIENAIEPFAKLLRIQSGHEVWEILPRELEDKGVAVKHRLAFLGGASSAIYVGDDIMDEAAFAVVPHGLTVRVGRPMTSHAQYHLAGVTQVAWFLEKLREEFA
jgi:trehalose 6-phosphate phosphatase